MIGYFERTYLRRPIVCSANLGCLSWVKRLHKNLKAICLEDVSHEPKNSQALLKVQFSKLAFAVPNFCEVKLRVVQAKLRKEVQGVRQLTHDLGNLMRWNDYRYPRLPLRMQSGCI